MKQFRARRFDRFWDAGDFADRQIVRHDDVAALERGSKDIAPDRRGT
jgi:hypothetical protein